PAILPDVIRNAARRRGVGARRIGRRARDQQRIVDGGKVQILVVRVEEGGVVELSVGIVGPPLDDVTLGPDDRTVVRVLVIGGAPDNGYRRVACRCTAAS